MLAASRYQTGEAPVLASMVPAGEIPRIKRDLIKALNQKGAAVGAEVQYLNGLIEGIKAGTFIRFIAVSPDQELQAFKKIVDENRGGVTTWHSMPGDSPAEARDEGVHFALGDAIDENDMVALVAAVVVSKRLADQIKGGAELLKGELLKEEVKRFVERELPGFKPGEDGVITPQNLAEFVQFSHQVAEYIQAMA